MILLTILLFIFARSLYHNISPIITSRMAALAFIFSFALTFNALYIQIIGSGIGIYCGLFQVTYYSLFIESFIYLIGSIILLSWGLIYTKDVSNVSQFKAFDLLTNNPSTMLEDITHREIRDIKDNNNTSIETTTKEYNNAYNLLDLNLSDNTLKSIGTSSESKDYSLITLFSVLGSSFLISSCDLLSMYLSIELQSFGLYILATIYRESGSATSAGLKYFLLGGLSSCIILLGTGILYGVTGLTDLNSIYSIISVFSSMPSGSSMLNDTLFNYYNLTENLNLGLSLGFIFIIVGFLFKIAAAPFHNWAPSVYDESPTNVTIWLTIMPKIAILLFLLEIYGNISVPLNVELMESDLTLTPGLALKNIFLLSSLLSLIIGTVVGLAQIKIKRLFAYSTISHVGFLLLALSIKTEQATESFLFYLIQYTITNLNAFFILLAFGYIINKLIKTNYINSDLQFISQLKGQFSNNPILSLSLIICLFSMAGMI